MAKENKCPFWTVSQNNRQGYGAEIVGIDNIAEAFSKSFVCDLVLCLSRTLDDKKNNTARCHLAKSRLGPDGIVFPLFYDLSCLDIRFFEPLGGQSTQNKEQTISKEELEEQKLALLEKWKQFKEGQSGKKDVQKKA